jgi:hypothetical protein
MIFLVWAETTAASAEVLVLRAFQEIEFAVVAVG